MKAVFINGKEDIELKEIEEISTQNNPEKQKHPSLKIQSFCANLINKIIFTNYECALTK